MKRAFLLLTMFAFFAINLKSQDTERPWLIGVSANYADFHAVELPFGDQLTDANWMGMTLPSQLKIGRSLNKSFNLSGEFSWIHLEKDKLNQFLSEYHVSDAYTPITNENLYRLNLQAEYKFANGYILKEDSWFDPYLLLGVNGTSIDELTYLGVPMGIGMNFWVLKGFGANIEGSYEYLNDYNDYFHYSLGLVYKFGKKSDIDKDGITDKKDLCPEIPGIAEFQGCPDTDGDGIPDKDDKCPKITGPKATFGCPDKDGDGVVDDIDKCPTVPGLASLSGCPDKDGDGIADNDDQCPDVKGPAATKGCPDTDGDGIIDKVDQCPYEKGLPENNGCPKKEIVVVPPIEKQKEIDFHANNILFEFNKASLRKECYESLDKLVVIMNEFPQSRYSVYGYTDNIGSDEVNLKLSKERAESVKNYLTEHGISASRLVSDGFGEKNPVTTNDTSEGREQNRRVEIKLLNK